MRWIRHIPHPTQSVVMQATGGLTTECPLGQEVWLVHWGEDGPDFLTQQTRAFNLQDQVHFGDFDIAYADEAMDMLYGTVEVYGEDSLEDIPH